MYALHRNAALPLSARIQAEPALPKNELLLLCRGSFAGESSPLKSKSRVSPTYVRVEDQVATACVKACIAYETVRKYVVWERPICSMPRVAPHPIEWSR